MPSRAAWSPRVRAGLVARRGLSEGELSHPRESWEESPEPPMETRTSSGELSHERTGARRVERAWQGGRALRPRPSRARTPTAASSRSKAPARPARGLHTLFRQEPARRAVCQRQPTWWAQASGLAVPHRRGEARPRADARAWPGGGAQPPAPSQAPGPHEASTGGGRSRRELPSVQTAPPVSGATEWAACSR